MPRFVIAVGVELPPTRLLDSCVEGAEQFKVYPLLGTHIDTSDPLIVPLPSISRKYQSPAEEMTTGGGMILADRRNSCIQQLAFEILGYITQLIVLRSFSGKWDD